MITKEQHIQYWIERADDDWKAVNTLLIGGNYLQALFFADLVIEKICKAIWILHNESNVPPKTHNLIYILSQTKISVPDNINEFLLNLNRFQLEGRYPEYINQMHKVCDNQFTSSMILKTNEIRLWLIGKLQ